ncbi:unnamed protein product [Anisakis simplex]|uniref:Uncharacterized protein n=1 Tax=Anisakis simplex TaxID=6269 RepID=A0A0M3KD62_ANISI|nr:unnamed protein product [Anisakis simplex]
MFVTGHPTTMTFSPLKHLRRFSSHSDSPPPKSPVDTLNDPLCCQLQLITALQGAEFDDTARHSLAMTIAKMQAAKRTALIQFITQVSTIGLVLWIFFRSVKACCIFF